MNETKSKLTLDQPTLYQIRVPGYLDQNWTDWNGGMTVQVENEEKGRPTTILTGKLDQAALLGLLRRLYALGLPLISVICLSDVPVV